MRTLCRRPTKLPRTVISGSTAAAYPIRLLTIEEELSWLFAAVRANPRNRALFLIAYGRYELDMESLSRSWPDLKWRLVTRLLELGQVARPAASIRGDAASTPRRASLERPQWVPIRR